MTKTILRRYNKYQQSHDYVDPNTADEYKTKAVLNGLLALGWVALGRASISHGWPWCLMLSMGSLKCALEEHTKAVSKLLILRRQRNLDKQS